MVTEEEEAGRLYAKALVQDIQENPRLDSAITHLVRHMPGSEAGIFIAAIKADLNREASDDFSTVIFPNVRRLFRRGIQEEGRIRSGMGFVGALLTVVVPSLVSAGTSVYTTKLQIDAQEDIAEMQMKQQAVEAEAIKAQAEAKKAEAEAAMALAAARTPEVTVQQGAAPSGGMPGWLLPVLGIGVVVLVGGAKLFGGKKKKRKR